ncbi:MAG: N-acetylneuraminate synthase family protein [Planctomycetota bacterium]|nr:N-acetylneuraminate synthase family protein [Planctomycetota bacterium]
MTETMRFGTRRVGKGVPALLIAEIGVNHNGSARLAERLVKAAAAAGADAVKFQLFKSEMLATSSASTAPYQKRRTRDTSQLTMLKKLELPVRVLARMRDLAARLKMEFFASVFDEESLKDAVGLRCAAVKLGSGELTNTPLIEKAARTGRPVVLSLGMSTRRDVDRAVRAVRRSGCRDLLLLHCVSAYPAPDAGLNLLKIPALRRRYRARAGFSDHSIGTVAALGAVALGACAVEKHFTLDRSLPGPDHKASSTPAEFGTFVTAVRRLESALGRPDAACSPAELEMRRFARKSIVAARPIPRGTVITRPMLACKRPGTGIPPFEIGRVVGRRTLRDLAADVLLGWDVLED